MPQIFRAPRVRRALLASFVIAAAASAACKSPSTYALINVDTDISPGRLTVLHLRCAYDWNGIDDRPLSSCDQTLVVRSDASSATTRLPGSFRIEALGDRGDQPVTVVIYDENVVVPRRILRVPFVRGQGRRASVFLSNACLASAARSSCHPCPGSAARCTLSESCEARGLTCGNAGTCRPIDLSSNELADDGPDATFPDGASDPPVDAGAACEPADGGVDAARDGSSPDAARTDSGRDARG